MSDSKPPLPPLPDRLAAIDTQLPNDILSAQLRSTADIAAQSAHQSAIEAASFATQAALSASSAPSFRTMGIETTYSVAPGTDAGVRVEVNDLGGAAPSAMAPRPNPTTPKGPKR